MLLCIVTLTFAAISNVFISSKFLIISLLSLIQFTIKRFQILQVFYHFLRPHYSKYIQVIFACLSKLLLSLNNSFIWHKRMPNFEMTNPLLKLTAPTSFLCDFSQIFTKVGLLRFIGKCCFGTDVVWNMFEFAHVAGYELALFRHTINGFVVDWHFVLLC